MGVDAARTLVSAARRLRTPDVIGGFGCGQENDLTPPEYLVLVKGQAFSLEAPRTVWSRADRSVCANSRAQDSQDERGHLWPLNGS